MAYLRKIRIDEVSVVRRPANRRRKLLQKAEWSTAYINDLPDSAFLYIEPGVEMDAEGKAVPRSRRHFPVRDASGRLDRPHLVNALARIPQSDVPDAARERASLEARKLLDQLKESEEKMSKRMEQLMQKAELSEDQAKAIMAALDALELAKEGMGPELYDRAVGELAKLLQPEMEQEMAQAQEQAEQAKAALQQSESVIKSALDKLQAPEPAVSEAVSELAKSVGVVPIVKSIEQLPADLRSAWDAMQEAQREANEKLEALQKSADEKAEKAEQERWLAKAESLSSVPMGSADLGNLLHEVNKSSPELGGKVLSLLEQVNKSVGGSPALSELGGGGTATVTDRSTAFAKVEAQALQMMQKSADLTRERAIAMALEKNPQLYAEYNRG